MSSEARERVDVVRTRLVERDRQAQRLSEKVTPANFSPSAK